MRPMRRRGARRQAGRTCASCRRNRRLSRRHRCWRVSTSGGGAQRTPLVNTIRGHAAEFGFVAAKGPAGIGPSSSSWRRATSRRWRELFAELAEEHAGLCAQTAAVDRRLRDWRAKNEVARRLTAILGVGRLIASLLVMKAPDPPHLFKSGRDFAAWLDAARPFHGRQGAGANHGGRRSDAAQPAYR